MTDRATWRQLLADAATVAQEAGEPDAVMGGPLASEAVLRLRHGLRTDRLVTFPLPWASAQAAQDAFILVGKAVLDTGLPELRARYARILAALSTELTGLLDDDGARATAEQLRRAGAGD